MFGLATIQRMNNAAAAIKPLTVPQKQVVGIHEVRLTRQSIKAKYGPGVYVVRRLTSGRKREEYSTSDAVVAREVFDREVKFCQRLEAEGYHPKRRP